MVQTDLAKCSWTQYKRCFPTGKVTSPNYPNNYPNNLQKTETIQVEKGLVLSLQFTAFDVDSWIHQHPNCFYDHLTITDGDGTTLMERSCDNILPADITSTSNIVKLEFITDTDTGDTKPGWSVRWSAVTPGEFKQHTPLFGLGLVVKFFSDHIEIREGCRKKNP